MKRRKCPWFHLLLFLPFLLLTRSSSLSSFSSTTTNTTDFLITTINLFHQNHQHHSSLSIENENFIVEIPKQVVVKEPKSFDFGVCCSKKARSSSFHLHLLLPLPSKHAFIFFQNLEKNQIIWKSSVWLCCVRRKRWNKKFNSKQSLHKVEDEELGKLPAEMERRWKGKWGATERLSAEALEALEQGLQSRTGAEVEKHGGTVVRCAAAFMLWFHGCDTEDC